MDERDLARFLVGVGLVVVLLVAVGRLRKGALRDFGRELLTLGSVPTRALAVSGIYLFFVTLALAIVVADDGASGWVLLVILAVVDSLFVRAMVERLRGWVGRGSTR